jgi:transposase
VQVADRFHLLQNLGDAAEKVLQRHTTLVQRIPRSGTAERAPPPRRDRESARAWTQAKTAQCYATIQAMKASGLSQRAIARALGSHRDTVRRYVAAATVPERPRRGRRPGILTPYEGYLRERWRQGERNGMALWREIVALGYPGKRGNVARLVADLRRAENIGTHELVAPQGLTPRQSVRLVLMRPETRNEAQAATIRQLAVLHPEIQQVLALVDGFAQLLRERTSEALDPWLEAARGGGIPEMARFVTKLRQDLDAVQAALSTEWSQGQVEGQITKLKLIRRQMYGRGNFDLVRKRVLGAA